jgi:2-polyprenyl-3-methyl-5-hydroxy-6-metoxy-1,4-benzoquinol methylase
LGFASLSLNSVLIVGHFIVHTKEKEFVSKKYICPILNRPTGDDETGLHQEAWSLVRCQETGLIFLADPPDYSQLESEFAWEETSTAERERRILEKPIISRLSSFIKKARLIAFPKRNKIASLMMAVTKGWNQPEPLQLLDIGCGWGNLMVDIYDRSATRGQKVIPCGIEVSEHLASLSADRVDELGGKVISANALDGSSEFKPDSIHVVMSSFLEHECRPLSLLKRLHPILKSTGVITLKVPNFACWNRIIRGKNGVVFGTQTTSTISRRAPYEDWRKKQATRFPDKTF